MNQMSVQVFTSEATDDGVNIDIVACKITEAIELGGKYFSTVTIGMNSEEYMKLFSYLEDNDESLFVMVRGGMSFSFYMGDCCLHNGYSGTSYLIISTK